MLMIVKIVRITRNECKMNCNCDAHKSDDPCSIIYLLIKSNNLARKLKIITVQRMMITINE